MAEADINLTEDKVADIVPAFLDHTGFGPDGDPERLG
jgi:hypothetical protein